MDEEKPQVTPADADASRKADGKWLAGKSPNPGGMSREHRQIFDAFRDKCRRYSPEAYNLLVSIARNGSENKDRLRALEMLLERAWGRAAQPITGDAEGDPIRLAAERMTSADRRAALAEALAAVRAATAETGADGSDG